MDHIEHLPGFDEVAGQRLVADHRLEFRAGADCVDDLADDLQPRMIGGEDGHHVHVGHHFTDAGVDAPFAQAMLAHVGSHFLGRAPRDQPRHLDPPHLLQRAKLEHRLKSAADNSET